MQTSLKPPFTEELGFDLVEREIRKRNFGVLATISPQGRPHSAGVLYAISRPKDPFILYVTTDRRSKKARNIANNRNVAFTIPLNRRFLRFMPPNSIQFQGVADLTSSDDEDARAAFSRSLLLRETLKLEASQRDAIFIRITPDPVVFTYGVGVSPLSLIKDIGGAARRSRIPTSLVHGNGNSS